MPMKDYAARQHARIETFMQRGATFVMLRPTDWDEGIVGYACGECVRDTNVFHWAYVKSAYRKEGVARALLAQLASEAFRDDLSTGVYTHLRKPYTPALERRGFKLNPYYVE